MLRCCRFRRSTIRSRVLSFSMSVYTTHMPIADNSISKLVTNPPWGRQVDSIGELGGDINALGREIRRVTRPGSRVVILSATPRQPPAGFHTFSLRPLNVAGSYPTLSLLVDADAPLSPFPPENARYSPELRLFGEAHAGDVRG